MKKWAFWVSSFLLVSLLFAGCSRPLVAKTRNVVNDNNISVDPGKWYDIPFDVTSVMQNATLVGTFRAAGGSGNGIILWIADDVNTANLINGHPGTKLYESGQVTMANINLPNLDPGKYHFIFTNTFSVVSSKTVSTKFDLNWYEYSQ